MILVTGNRGYLGSVLVKKLEDYRGYDVEDGCDINDSYMLGEAMKNVDAVVHLAAVVGEEVCSKRSDYAWEVNAWGCWRLIDVAFNAGIKKVFLASTCSVYGDRGEKVVDESFEGNPWGVYSTTKYMAECYARWLGYSVLRFGSLYGGTRASDSLPEVMKAEAEAGKLTVQDGLSWRPFTHVEDAANAILHVLKLSNHPKVLNVVGENMRKRELAKLIANHFKASLLVDKKMGRSYRVSSSKLLGLGFKFQWNVKKWLT